MDKPTALREGLREQTIIIEDCTAELKRLLNRSVFNGGAMAQFLQEADKLILDRTEEMKDDSLRQSARATLRAYARKEFERLRSALTVGIAGFSFVALALVKKIWNADTAEAKTTAFRALQKIEPQFVDYQVTFAPGQGQSWRWGTPLNGYMQSYMKAVNQTARLLANDAPKAADGLTLRLKSELYVRHQWQEANLQELRDSGERFVWISSHENCSERCQDWQGKLYSTDGTSGVHNGISFQPLEKATDRYYTTKAGTTYKNGTLSGFGCRHYTIPYREDGVRPMKMQDDRIEQARAVEQKQRQLEREVFKLREQYYANKDNNDILARRYYTLAADKRKEYIAFCRDNKVAWYPSRIQVNP